ncbi:MAG TPA: hypothetical protein VHH72_09015 [Solirubrobacterales bacterium]|jgi:hypothetical protein|nr:hypothetical protein [Solirubrobacterales bacterium]
MRRLRTVAVCSLLLAALVPSTAEGATQMRRLQGDFGTLPPGQSGGRIVLGFIFKNKRANKGKFTPRQLTSIGLEGVPLRCANSPGDPASSALLTTSIPARKTPRSPRQANPKPNRYSFSFSSGFSDFDGTVGGRVYKRNGRGRLLTFGNLTIRDIDFSAPGPSNCSTTGERSWSGGAVA